MCLLFLSNSMTADFRLVLAGNRDEFLARSTASLGILDAGRGIAGGRDLVGGGTWLAVDVLGRFGVITNYRDPAAIRLGGPSRGEIIMNYLQSGLSAAGFIDALQAKGHRYSGFNLIVGDDRQLWYYSNQQPQPCQPCQIGPGYYGLCNHLLDTPWPKLVRGKELLHRELVDSYSGSQQQAAKIFNLLEDSWRPEESELPNTGIALEKERLLSSIFIDGADYGTRSSALLSIGCDGQIDFRELEYLRQVDGLQTKLRHLRFHPEAHGRGDGCWHHVSAV